MNQRRVKIPNLADIPNHIAIIMDGNGRWASSKKLPRIAGHKEGINSVREITRVCGNIGVKYLTLYTFSTENWKRPKKEVSALMNLLLNTINSEIKKLNKENVKFTVIGDLTTLPKTTFRGLADGIELTKDNDGLTMCLALNYGSRQEIINAVKKIYHDIKMGQIKVEDIDEKILYDSLYTKNMPDPDLLIRTSGEFRISNFLLWQIAYTEIVVTKKYWPDFREKELFDAIVDYQSRERRYGKISGQK